MESISFRQPHLPRQRCGVWLNLLFYIHNGIFASRSFCSEYHQVSFERFFRAGENLARILNGDSLYKVLHQSAIAPAVGSKLFTVCVLGRIDGRYLIRNKTLIGEINTIAFEHSMSPDHPAKTAKRHLGGIVHAVTLRPLPQRMNVPTSLIQSRFGAGSSSSQSIEKQVTVFVLPPTSFSVRW